jgi:hypothetical protein
MYASRAEMHTWIQRSSQKDASAPAVVLFTVHDGCDRCCVCFSTEPPLLRAFCAQCKCIAFKQLAIMLLGILGKFTLTAERVDPADHLCRCECGRQTEACELLQL